MISLLERTIISKVQQKCLKTCLYTYIDEVVIVTDEEVPEYSGLIEVTQADHVLHAINGGRMQRLQLGASLHPVLLRNRMSKIEYRIPPNKRPGRLRKFVLYH